MDYEISDHARDEMESSNIIEDEVKACLEYGNLEIKQSVKNELRYGKKIQLKDKTIIVIYTKVKDKIRVITAYPIRRKKW
ncbi:MAG: DUF4258 domain-containing protein [Nanoarchaeota archaeon]